MRLIIIGLGLWLGAAFAASAARADTISDSSADHEAALAALASPLSRLPEGCGPVLSAMMDDYAASWALVRKFPPLNPTQPGAACPMSMKIQPAASQGSDSCISLAVQASWPGRRVEPLVDTVTLCRAGSEPTDWGIVAPRD